MKIYDVTKIYGVYESRQIAGRRLGMARAPGRNDELTLSRDAVDFQAVMRGLREAPDVRAMKVSEFSIKYQAGDHLADSRDVAAAIFKSGTFSKV